MCSKLDVHWVVITLVYVHCIIKFVVAISGRIIDFDSIGNFPNLQEEQEPSDSYLWLPR